MSILKTVGTTAGRIALLYEKRPSYKQFRLGVMAAAFAVAENLAHNDDGTTITFADGSKFTVFIDDEQTADMAKFWASK